ncbi:hypothetical protein NX85_19035 [Aeromonas salmonicida subsp. salmonicida]|nr:hypothetical protein NX85_19035 [Aeromonas salmonicida subsp. salmonicida]
MQLIKQTLELIVIDKFVDFFLYRRQRVDLEGAAMLTLTMQLVEQGFELVVGDVTGAGQYGIGNRGRRPASTMQFIEQTLELIGRDFIDGAATIDGQWCSNRLGFGNHDSSLNQFFPMGRGIIASGGSQQLLLPLGLAELMQIMQDFGGCRAWWFAILHLGKHHIDGVQCLQNNIHQLGSDGSLAIAQDVEHVFGTVTDVYQFSQREKTGAAFNGMKASKYGIQQILVIGSLFQVDQLFGQLFQYFGCFDQKVLQYVFINFEGHASLH